MKKLVALAVLVLVGMTAQANQVTGLDHGKKRGIRYNNSQPITFIQKGVKFFVYTNGEFDFTMNTPMYSGRRGFEHNAPGVQLGVSFPYRNRGVISYDRWGNITKVGRNYIAYNRRGKVNQIGHIALRYKNGRLINVGNMKVKYDKWGRIRALEGNIIYDNTSCGICGIDGCSINHFGYKDSHDGHNHHNNDGDWNNNNTPFKRNKIKKGGKRN